MNISITNVHLDLGAGRRGTDMGPSAIHVAGLIPGLTELGHGVVGVRSLEVETFETLEAGDPRLRFLDAITSVCGRLSDCVEGDVEAGCFPLVLGGDHAQAIGTISGLARYWRRREQQVGVVWVDAHTDMNTPDSTPSGNIHGMPLATLLGYGAPGLVSLAGETPALDPRNVVVVGARNIDARERELVRKTGVRVYTMSELDARGTAVCLREAFEIASSGTAGVHLSFDLDGVDPRGAPGVGTPEPGGLTIRESHLLCEMAAKCHLLGMEMVELNPTLDHANETGRLAVWLILSALGKTIL